MRQNKTKLYLETTQILKCKEEVWPTKIPQDVYMLPMKLLCLPSIEIDLSKESDLRMHNKLL